MPRIRWIMPAVLLGVFVGSTAEAQITEPRTLSASSTRVITIEEQLINRLRATREDQRAYLRFVVKQVNQGKLDLKLVIAMEHYAIRRRPDFPFPIFERIMRFQAERYGIELPPAQTFATTGPLPR